MSDDNDVDVSLFLTTNSIRLMLFVMKSSKGKLFSLHSATYPIVTVCRLLTDVS